MNDPNTQVGFYSKRYIRRTRHTYGNRFDVGRYLDFSKYLPHQGEQECERRKRKLAPVAQRIEHGASISNVAGLNPAGRSK